MSATTLDRRSLLRLGGLAAGGSLLATAGLAPDAEAAATTMKATGNVYVRAAATTSSRAIAVLRKGQAVTLAGAVRGRWQPIRVGKRTGYVSTRYLTRSGVTSSVPAPKPAAPRNLAGQPAAYASLPLAARVTLPGGVTARGAAIGAEVKDNFPQVATMLGRRSEPGSDHNSGRAVDIMLPGNYRGAAQQALGTAIAEHMRANAGRLGISYVIWNQHIWSVQRQAEGWRLMANRGSDNANHKNHVHVSVN